MNDDEFKAIQQKGFVEVSPGVFAKPKRAVSDIRAATPAKSQPDIGYAPPQPPSRKAIYTGRVLVCITSYCCGQQRDADNIFVKHGLDCCRLAGIISDDSPEQIELRVTETRVPTKKEEGFEIVITPL